MIEIHPFVLGAMIGAIITIPIILFISKRKSNLEKEAERGIKERR